MQEDKTPKVFISYSWSSDELVLDLAQRLVNHGVDVVLDKWDLKEGQDKYAFMERCVNDSEITKVLIFCDKAYAQKANDRTGGVGDETVIISSEIYGKTQQDKFIPIIVQKDENSEPYVPIYIKTRIYIDLSDEDKFEQEYEKLLRNIYDRPQYVKPKLGQKPEWLDEQPTDYFQLKDLIRQIKGSTTESKQKHCINRFKDAYIECLKGFFEQGATPKRIFEIFLSTKPARDYFLDFVEAISETSQDYAELLVDYFEKMYNDLTCPNTFSISSLTKDDVAVYKILIWELFIDVIAFMRYASDYFSINLMLTNTYFINHNGLTKPINYPVFRYYCAVIEEKYKPQTEKKRNFTLLGDVICNQREKLPIYTKDSIATTDLFLYQVYRAYDFGDKDFSFPPYWFPTCYVYAKNMPIEWGKMVSRRYCDKMMQLFGVNDIDELKNAISKCTIETDIQYAGSFSPALPILSSIKIEEIGTLN